jgi:nicotinate phosphoribosyltransferase
MERILSIPENHHYYTDKYFIRTHDILKKEALNPSVSLKVFTRGEGRVAGLEEAVKIIQAFSDIPATGEVWVSKEKNFKTKQPLMILKGPAQSLIQLETLYLGVLSHAISRAAGIPEPDPAEIETKMKRLVSIYEEIPVIYFGARHYHWSLDSKIAAAALAGGAIQTSTDAGSANIGKEGVGTTPHFLTIILAPRYGKNKATLKTAELFDRHMPRDIPRVTLVDTFNREISDGLEVARYFGKRKNALRVDTCGENVGEDGTPFKGEKGRDPSFRTGTGVTLELLTHLRNRLMDEGFGESTDIFLSSGFGNEEKAAIFMKAHREFREKTGLGLFAGVGVGELSKAIFCTSDIFEVEGKPLAKTGRENTSIDYTTMERVF